ncbi:hypothetical protein PR202_ga25239 [Eleusine coracana subsp. coracana]|uniref:KIB1-4 beta-propeller domain-containing protein n=1 Tax=Eleusine coracana subsp. coracana TaxID=191504 RepID=A0AAV5DAY9_ELECO|nr:hypothetical protein PR202_ga25239 [Eleusine coracana subsp. coracana]
MAEVTLLRSGHRPSWADIPRDLAGMVLRLLPARADRARFAAVCPQWRAAKRQLPLPRPLPLLALEDGTFFSLPYGKTFRFAGRSCADYKAAACGRCKCFEDMAFYQGKLYTVAADYENLLVINISQDPSTGDPEVSRIRQVIKGDLDPTVEALFPDDAAKFVRKLYLVESRGTLLMVRRKVYCSSTGSMLLMAGQSEFEVFRADIEHSRWVRVTTLGDDQMIFLGRYYSKAVSASQYGISGDHIFFLDDDKVNMMDYLYDKESTSVGVYDMKTHKISPLCRWSGITK